jgi:anaerobic C4-dicarboxylate transporter
MQLRLLTLLNIAIAIALACFVYTMLPFANGVACELAPKPCEPLSTALLVIAALVPSAVIASTVLLAFRVRRSRPRIGLTLFLLWPLTLAIWVAIAWAQAAP